MRALHLMVLLGVCFRIACISGGRASLPSPPRPRAPDYNGDRAPSRRGALPPLLPRDPPSPPTLRRPRLGLLAWAVGSARGVAYGRVPGRAGGHLPAPLRLAVPGGGVPPLPGVSPAGPAADGPGYCNGAAQGGGVREPAAAAARGVAGVAQLRGVLRGGRRGGRDGAGAGGGV